MSVRIRLLWTLAAVGIALGARIAVAGEGVWTLKTETDPLTDVTRQVATVTNTDGFSFSIYRAGTGQVWANFSIPSANPAILDANNLIRFRIDKYPALDLDGWAQMQHKYGDHLIDTQPKWINFVVPPSDLAGSDRTLRRLQKGSALLVRFYLFTGGSRDTTFPLTGARHAIAAVAGVPETWDEADETRAEEKIMRHTAFEAAGHEAVHRCSAGHDANGVLSCTMQVGDCKRRYPNADQSEEILQSFVACTQTLVGP